MSLVAILNNPIIGTLIISVLVQGAVLLYKWVESKHPKVSADIAKDIAIVQAHSDLIKTALPIITSLAANIPAVAKVETELAPLKPLVDKVEAEVKKDEAQPTTPQASVLVVNPGATNQALGVAETVAKAAANLI
jgi:type IV secretory pathway VirJ component